MLHHPFVTTRVLTDLTGGVPELEPYGAVLKIHRFTQKVDADSSLVCVIESVVHESNFQKESVYTAAVKHIYRTCLVIKLVFPTL